MLVLRRKENETIHMGEYGSPTYPIIVHILAVEGDRVKVGIEAPTSINVVRGELLTEAANVPTAASVGRFRC